MYREVIEHPASLPPMIKKHLDLTSGRDRGRIYRIVPDGFQQPPLPRLDQATTAELVTTLAHPNGWHRDTAARLLYQRQDKAAIALLDRQAWRRRRALRPACTLVCLARTGSIVRGGRGQGPGRSTPRVREHAVRLAEGLIGKSRGVRLKLVGMTGDA